MRQIDLREYERSEPVALAIDERDRLAEALRGSITIEPEPGAQDRYYPDAGLHHRRDRNRRPVGFDPS